MPEENIEITKSSGNVFEDMGFPDSQEAYLKSRLAMLIHVIIESKGLTQVQAAKIMGTAQPHVSDIVRGKLSDFSIERLFNFILALGQDIEITVKNHQSKSGSPTIYVSPESLAM